MGLPACISYLQQVGCGVALGIFQMEPATYSDLFDNYLRYHQDILQTLDQYFKTHQGNFELNLKGNLIYQIVIARLQYRRFPEKIPSINPQYHQNSLPMACYYKKYWNTELGKATIAEVLFNYDKYAF